MPKWELIESAPKDGSRILAIDPAHNNIGIVIWQSPEWEMVDMRGSGLGIGFYPTHWQPLPSPPEGV